MKTFYLLFMMLVLVLASCTKPLTEDEVLEQIEAVAKNIQSFSYDARYEIKYLTATDTTRIEGRCYVVKDESDSLHGYKAHLTMINEYGSFESIYRISEAFSIDHNEKKVTYNDTPQENEITFINGNIIESLVSNSYAKGIDFAKYQEDSVSIEFVDFSKSKEHWHIKLTYPDNEEVRDMITQLWFNKKTFLLEKSQTELIFQDMLQYTRSEYSNIIINSPDIEDHIANFTPPEDYTFENYSPMTEEDRELLPLGSTPPDFELSDINGNLYKLSDLKGKVVLIDFWYMSCHPCLMSLPHLQELYEKYSDQGFILLGINSTDSDVKENLKNFLEKRNITYPVLLAERELDKSYNVTGYPTMYILDKSGKIVYAEIGFGETLVEVIEDIIKKSL